MLDLLKTLCEAWGPPGYEHHVRDLIRAEVEALADEVRVDALGNLICRVGSGGPKVLVAVHMDEIGVMTTFQEPESGYLRFTALGALIYTTLRGGRVQFEDGTFGVIGVHRKNGATRTNVPKLDEFYIDADDGSGPTVAAGSPGVFWREMVVQGQRITAKALDDRVGCVIAIEALRRLEKSTPNEVYVVFTVQEEVGSRGAKTAGFGVDPDVAVAVDVTLSGDEAQGAKMAVRLGAGAAIKVHDTGHIVPPAVVNWMVNTASAKGIPFQRELLTGGTTDIAAIQIARAGVPGGVISIPCRYVHTPSETVDLRDVEAALDLLTALLANPAEL